MTDFRAELASAAEPLPHRDARFPIGTQFKYGRMQRLCTVTDILRTFNSAGELVSVRYVATHSFMGQTVTDHDVSDVAIAKGITAERA